MKRKFFYPTILLISILLIGAHLSFLVYKDDLNDFGAGMFFILFSVFIVLVDIVLFIIYEIIAWYKRKHTIS